MPVFEELLRQLQVAKDDAVRAAEEDTRRGRVLAEEAARRARADAEAETRRALDRKDEEVKRLLIAKDEEIARMHETLSEMELEVASFSPH